MKVSITFDVDDEIRRAVARSIDSDKKYDGKRKATRSEVIGIINDGAENSLDDVVHQYRIRTGKE